MNIKRHMLTTALIALFALAQVNAATVTLKDGRAIEGKIKSQNSETIVVDMNGIEMRIPASEVALIDLQSSTSLDNTDTAAVSQTNTTTQDSSNIPVTVPAGTAITIRMSESVNSRNHKTGQRFTGVLEANLMAGNVVVAPKGAQVYGVLSNVKKAGRIAGSASMQLELRDISINNVMVAIRTQAISGTGENTAKTSVGRTARAAAIGGLIGGGDGAKTGAKVGVGAAILTQGSDIEVPKGTLLDFILTAPIQG
ncbi:hypothetical protein [Psychromonas sp. MME2]|uniref:hypothetical protein n=1 Tax=unclassified Psychromonas TaxID=2614957 RepID=UPI00339CFCB0